MNKIKVLIIDDSKLIQTIISRMLLIDPAIDVIGTANDAYEALDIINSKNPDVLTLDVEMPGMDGIAFLRSLMRLHPLPVVMVSSHTHKGENLVVKALSIGAVNYFVKPTSEELREFDQYAHRLIYAIKVAAKTNVRPLLSHIYPLEETNNLHQRILSIKMVKFLRKQIIAIGASLGGIEALRLLITELRPPMPAILIVQHIQKELCDSFINHLKEISKLKVLKASDDMEIMPGHIYFAPGDEHLRIKSKGTQYFCGVEQSFPVHGHRPSVDVLFRSAALMCGENTIGCLLTGMGSDGAIGLKEIKDAGGTTIAQDEKTSVIWGMPGAAVKIGAVNQIVPLNKIVQVIMQILNKRLQSRY